MIKIVASVLTLSIAFASGVVVGAKRNQPEIKKIAAIPTDFKSSKVQAFLNPKRNTGLKTKPIKAEKKANAKVSLSTSKLESPDQSEEFESKNKFLNKNRTGYTVLISSFKVEENADNYAEKVSKKGYDAFYFSKEIQGKTWHRVGVGSFSSKATANSLRKQLMENRLGKGSLISKIPQAKPI